MKKYKVKEVLKLLRKDGWYLSAQKGSHRQYKHSTKGGKVTDREWQAGRYTGSATIKQHLETGRVALRPCT